MKKLNTDRIDIKYYIERAGKPGYKTNLVEAIRRYYFTRTEETHLPCYINIPILEIFRTLEQLSIHCFLFAQYSLGNSYTWLEWPWVNDLPNLTHFPKRLHLYRRKSLIKNFLWKITGIRKRILNKKP